MKTKTRERAIRILLSSIIGSDLTAREMQELSEAFLRGSEFSQDLGIIIKNLALDLKVGFHITKQDASDNLEIQEFTLEEAMEVIRRKRISKNKIVSLIRIISPKAGSYYDSKREKMTVKQIIQKFYDAHGREQFYDFMSLVLRGDRTQDEYLKGIMSDK